MEDDDFLKEKRANKKKKINDSNDSQSTSSTELVQMSSPDLQVENQLTKALLLLNPESITPRQALEIIYELQSKARSKSY